MPSSECGSNSSFDSNQPGLVSERLWMARLVTSWCIKGRSALSRRLYKLLSRRYLLASTPNDSTTLKMPDKFRVSCVDDGNGLAGESPGRIVYPTEANTLSQIDTCTISATASHKLESLSDKVLSTTIHQDATVATETINPLVIPEVEMPEKKEFSADQNSLRLMTLLPSPNIRLPKLIRLPREYTVLLSLAMKYRQAP
ncbi:unnamed protein product [Protopolystoma xenopodis]|uniref:Uncharacterized protein n=1 Tax=Protopolystoma xenopodis TaxID=117903 RepID=A0A3S5C5K0_9PLAT|nr:unnamed protein product [Protopolystoma xenopodis]